MTRARWAEKDARFDQTILGLPSELAQLSAPEAAIYAAFDVTRMLDSLERGFRGRDSRRGSTFGLEDVILEFVDAFEEVPAEQLSEQPFGDDRDKDNRSLDPNAGPIVWLGPRTPKRAERRDKGIESFFEALKKGQEKAKVALGVADTAIAFAHQRFRKIGPNGEHLTRFKMLWLQDRFRTNDPSSYSGILAFGTLLLENDINDMFAAHTHNGVLDERGVYAEFESVRSFGRDLWSLDAGHGTAVLDLMGGAVPGDPGSDRPIYGVELPTAVVADTSGGLFHGPLVAGLATIALMTFIMSPGASVIMNASMAFVGGPHGGKRGGGKDHPTARALARLLDIAGNMTGRDVRLTLPSGNHLQDQLFAESSDVTWVVPPNDRTASSLEIWLDRFEPWSSVANFSLSVKAPGVNAAELDVAPAPGTYRSLLIGQQEVGRLYRISVPGSVADHLEFVVYPTHSYDPAQRLSPPGFWEVSTCESHALFWSLRDDTLSGLPEAGQQARLNAGSYRKFEVLGDFATTSDTGRRGVRRDGSLSVIATPDPIHGGGTKDAPVIVYGSQGSRKVTAEDYRFSGLDLDLNRHGLGMNALEAAFLPRAEVSRSLGGPLSARRTGRGTLRLPGTSMASAIFARHIADQMTGTSTGDPEGYREPG
ncbi:MAG: hypothetical protein AAFP28_03285 [Pseudomonadota bacterium]